MRKTPHPTDWKLVHLGSVAEIQTGIAKGKPRGDASKSVPYLRVANVQDGHLNLAEIKTITVADRDIPRYSLKSGDVLFTEGGDFDKLGRGTVWREEIPLCVHQNHVFAVRPQITKLVPQFLAYLASSPHGRRYFQSASKQSTNLASINSTQLKRFPIHLPPVVEQTCAVSVIETWDEAIERLSSLLAAKVQMRNGVLQKLFKTLSDPHRRSKVKKTSFGDVFIERQDRNYGLTPDDVVTVGKYAIRKQSEHFTRSVASRDLSNYWTISPGDFVYDPMSAYYGALGRYTGHSDGIVSPAYRVLRLRKDVLPEFMAYVLKSHRVRFLLETRSSQGNKEGKRRLLQRDEFAAIDFVLPSQEEQQAFVDTVSQFEMDIERTTALLKAVQQQKHGLMQKLLTGEWRLKV